MYVRVVIFFYQSIVESRVEHKNDKQWYQKNKQKKRQWPRLLHRPFQVAVSCSRLTSSGRRDWDPLELAAGEVLFVPLAAAAAPAAVSKRAFFSWRISMTLNKSLSESCLAFSFNLLCFL